MPFLRLQRLIGAHAIFSADKDFLVGARGIVPGVVRFELREFARAQTLYLSVVVGGPVAVSIALVGVLGLIEAVARLLIAAPRWLQFVLITAVVAVLVNPSWRSSIARKLDAIARVAPEVWAAVGPALAIVASQAADADERSKEMWRSITAAIPAAVESPSAAGEYRVAPRPITQRSTLTRRRRSYGGEKVRRATPRRRVAGKSTRSRSGKFASSDSTRGGGAC